MGGAASRQGKVVQLQLKSSSNSEKQLSQPWPTTRTCRRSRSWEGQPSNLSAGTGLDGRLSGTCSTTQTLERSDILPSKPGSPNLLLPLYGQGPQCQLPCTPRCCEDQPQGGPRGSAHPHRVQGLLRWSEARDQDKGGDGHVRAAD